MTTTNAVPIEPLFHLCSSCGINPAAELHPCPYDCEINGNCDDQCDCCPDCENRCTRDI